MKKLPEPKPGKRRLIFLISTKGKTSEEIKLEGWQAFQKYKKVKEDLAPKIPI